MSLTRDKNSKIFVLIEAFLDISGSRISVLTSKYLASSKNRRFIMNLEKGFEFQAL